MPKSGGAPPATELVNTSTLVGAAQVQPALTQRSESATIKAVENRDDTKVILKEIIYKGYDDIQSWAFIWNIRRALTFGNSPYISRTEPHRPLGLSVVGSATEPR